MTSSVDVPSLCLTAVHLRHVQLHQECVASAAAAVSSVLLAHPTSGYIAVHSSPYRRCLQTAGAIARSLKVDCVFVDNRLGEFIEAMKRKWKGGAPAAGGVAQLSYVYSHFSLLSVSVSFSLTVSVSVYGDGCFTPSHVPFNPTFLLISIR